MKCPRVLQRWYQFQEPYWPISYCSDPLVLPRCIGTLPMLSKSLRLLLFAGILLIPQCLVRHSSHLRLIALKSLLPMPPNLLRSIGQRLLVGVGKRLIALNHPMSVMQFSFSLFSFFILPP